MSGGGGKTYVVGLDSDDGSWMLDFGGRLSRPYFRCIAKSWWWRSPLKEWYAYVKSAIRHNIGLDWGMPEEDVVYALETKDERGLIIRNTIGMLGHT
jgi:hypothetical protein